MAGLNVKQHDVNLENRILSLMFKNENIIDIVLESNVEDKDFTLPINQSIFSELIDIYRNYEFGGICIGDDTSILFERLKTGDRENDKELLITLNKIKNTKCNEKHINLYIKELTDYTKIRGIVEANRAVTNYFKTSEIIDTEELIQIYDDAYQNVFSNILMSSKTESTQDAVKTTIKELLEDSMQETKVKFNLDGIDDYAKILNGYLTYILGDTGVGKTTVGTYLATACAKNGIKVLYVNLETRNQDCIKKLISANVDIDGYRIKYPHLINPVLMTEKDWDVIENLAIEDTLASYGIHWLFRPTLTTSELKREIIKAVRMYDIDMVIGDYFQLLVKDGYEDAPESVTIPKISKDLMEMSARRYINPDGKEKLLAHVWLSQTVKGLGNRIDKHPTKDDMYFGGQRDARLILGIYRDEYYDDETRKPGIMELGILKQNNGIANIWFDYKFDAQYQIIRDLTEEEQEILNDSIDDEE